MGVGLEVTDGSATFVFNLVSDEKTKKRPYKIDTTPWESQDGQSFWRIALHPWDGGLKYDRIPKGTPRPFGLRAYGAERSYAKGNCDASFSHFVTFPPLLNALTFTNASNPPQVINFNGADYVNGGRYIYKIDSSYTVTEDKDFGVGKACVSMAKFNSELVFAMGESEKIWKLNTSGTYTQATDATYAIALGVVGKLLYRAETTNLVSACSTTPLTLSSWTPSTAANKYVVGDSTYAVHTICDYGGAAWFIKGDGAYTGDNIGQIFNQTPQLARYPHANNGKGAFVAQGALWVPSAAGLIRVRPGEAVSYGPELTERPGYRFWVRGGVEWGDSIYLIANDLATSENSVIIKMDPDEHGYSDHEYVFHEWCRLGGTNVPYFIGVSTSPTVPTMYVGYGNNGFYIKLGNGGGRYIDDANFSFGTSLTLETGAMMPADDLSVVSRLIGVTTLCRFQRTNDSLSVQYAVDGGSYINLLTDQESGAGTAPITLTSGFDSVTRYAPTDTTAVGQFFEFKFAGTLVTSCTGTTAQRPEIREAWAFGSLHPTVTDVVTMVLNGDASQVTSDGTRNQLGATEVETQFKSWRNSSKVMAMVLDGYEDGHTTRFYVTDVKLVEDTPVLGNAGRLSANWLIEVTLRRSDYSGAYAT